MKKNDKKRDKKKEKNKTTWKFKEKTESNFTPRLIRQLAGGWRIEEWYVLLVLGGPAGKRSFTPVMFFRNRQSACRAWRDDFDCAGKIRPVQMLVGPLSDYAIPMFDIASVGVEMKVSEGHFGKGFPQALWETW